MNSSKIQKAISFFILFFFLFNLTFQTPFISFFSNYAEAKDNKIHNLVSIIVSEDIYPEIKTEIETYAKDIQKTLENTRTIILPTPKDTNPFKIASLNESLYFDGYKGLDNADFESKLIGTILVGNIKIPTVYNSSLSSKTIIPYTDFEEKSYIYNHKIGKYEKTPESPSKLKTEIWHGFISPNTGDENKDIQAIKDYFKKNHDFYSGNGNFKKEKNISNGNLEEPLSSEYKPYVFYFDQFRESKSIIYSKYKGYEGYLENKEDLNYSRFSKKLGEKLKDKILGTQKKQINDTLKPSTLKLLKDSNIDIKKLSSGPDLTNIPDIQTRQAIKSSTNKYLEIFNSGTIGKLRKYVHNAGRYNGKGKEVNVDMIPFLISILDIVSDEVLRNANNDLEEKIDSIVKNGLSRKIVIPTSISNSNCGVLHTNFLHGKKGDSINEASECSIHRGSTYNSGTLVEANRGFNIKNISSDLSACNRAETSGYWGGNSPINLNQTTLKNGLFSLKSNDITLATKPLFDIAGSKEIKDSSKNATALNCLDNNYITTQNNCTNISSISCGTNNKKYDFEDDFFEVYTNNPETRSDCGKNVKHTFSGNNISIDITNYRFVTVTNTDIGGNSQDNSSSTECSLVSSEKYSYKIINSQITHKSPTSKEISKQISNLTTPSLPIDKDRYIDFIGANGEHKKINYPYLFRVKSLDLKETLDEKSSEINSIINSLSPSSLTGSQKRIYENYLKTGSYPETNINLYDYLKSKETRNYRLNGDSKEINYYDSIVFAVHWNSLNSSSAKYKFIFENYLSDEFLKTDLKYHIPKNKKQYEISYLGAPGDSENMYIKVDPKQKDKNPYASIISKNIELNSKLFASNISSKTKKGENFKCAPPEGVPISEWIPAIVCWLEDMLPPKIGISDGVCGPSLLSDEEREEILECSGDFNKNGINDCVEKKLKGGRLELLSDASKYYYNKQGKLEATIKDKDGKIVRFDNSTYINFEISKVEIPKDYRRPFSVRNKKVIYEKRNHSKKSFKEALKYINFKNLKIKAQSGQANYNFSTKSKNANVYFKAFIRIENYKKISKIFLKSGELAIKIRGDRIFVNSSKILNGQNNLEIDNFSSSVGASDKTNIFLIDENKQKLENISNIINNSSLAEEKLILSLSNFSKNGTLKEINYPITVDILSYGEPHSLNPYSLQESGNRNSTERGRASSRRVGVYSDLSNFKALFALKKSGNYKITIKDSNGFKVSKNIVVNPLKPEKIDVKLGTTISETGGNITTHTFVLLDKYDNPSIGNLYKIDLEIEGKGILFEENDKKQLLLQTFEGYKAFKIKSTNKKDLNKINFSVKNSSGDSILKDFVNFRTLDEIKISLDSTPIFKVGGNDYELDLSFKDSSGNILSELKSRVYTKIDSIYADIKGSYNEIKSGKTKIKLKTSNTAGKDIVLSFQVEGLKNIYTKKIEILPDKPMKIDLSLSKSKIQASPSDYSILNVELKDRYGNLVTSDNTSKAFIEISDDYTDIIKADTNFKNIKSGKSQFKIYGTNNPGVAYFKVKIVPSLEENSFEIKDNANNKIVISGISENAGKIETFYFWNAEKIKGNAYNSLYTILLGSSYGDINKENYLAGGMLFDKDNRSLAVTSLLNDPYKYSNVLNIEKSSQINSVYEDSDLSQDINFSVNTDDKKRFYINIFNDSLNILLGKVYLNFPEKTTLKSCPGNSSSLDDCSIPEKNTSILLKSFSSDYLASKKGDKLVFETNFGENIFSIDSKGKLEKQGSFNLELKKDSREKHMSLLIKSNSKTIGTIAFNFVGANISIFRDESMVERKLEETNNSLIVFLQSNLYLSRDNGESKSIYYNDPFESKFSLNNFSKNNLDAFENFAKKSGIGWEGGNKSLLSFSAGKSVGESTKDYMSFSLINLGDPVFKLRKISNNPKKQTKKSFDRSIGKLLSTDSDISNYRVFDYNNDLRDDIILIKDSSYIKLLENTDSTENFLDRGNLVNTIDIGNKELIQVGDFTGDSYDDIFFVDKNSKPFLFNNFLKDFKRIDLGNQFEIKSRIVRAVSFDMNNDKKTDIVTLDEAGEINIFYGGGTPKNPSFSKLLISKDHFLKLNSNPRNDGALIYYKGLPQGREIGDNSDILASNKRFLSKLRNNNIQDEEIENSRIIDKLIFVSFPYDPNPINTIGRQSPIINGIDDISEYITGIRENPQNYEEKNTYKKPKLTSFLKSEYSSSSSVSIKKIFENKNNKNLKSGDIVKVTVTLKNRTNNFVQDIAYIDSIDKIFKLNTYSIKIGNKEIKDTKKAPYPYNFLLDDISLKARESIQITYELKVLPLKYSYLQVGLFEDGELGDDKFGDILIKPDNKNCATNSFIYRSIESKKYLKGVKALSCDTTKLKLPGDLEKNKLDENGNGIPDYIEKIGESSSSLQDYAKKSLEKIRKDSDQDGIPNIYDDTSLYNSEKGDILSSLDKINEKVDEISNDIDFLVEGFGCGFGGGTCLNLPLNWAPLAPGSDPVAFGKPIGDGLKVNEGYPVFSALTGLQTSKGCFPAVWPISSRAFIPGPVCGPNSAGGSLGVWSPTNFVRLFVTPTITGAVGIAACYGGPAITAGYSNPPGVHPLVPGGNCIISATPILGCKDDGSDGDINSIGFANFNKGIGVINGNCDYSSSEKKIETPIYFEENLVTDYLKYKKTGLKSNSLRDRFKNTFKRIAKKENERESFDLNQPLISLDNGGEQDMEIKVSIDFSSLDKGNFNDIIKIEKKRVSAFPDFLMDWVTRQIEEIIIKLTDFPTLFLILPDFSGVSNHSWKDFPDNLKKSYDKGESNRKIEKAKTQKEIDILKNEKKSLNCSSNYNSECIQKDIDIKKLQAKKSFGGFESNSGIKSAYDFLSNIPLVEIEEEVVNINVPWIEEKVVNKTLIDWKLTKKQWIDEINRFKDSVSFGKACNYKNKEKQKSCEQENHIREKIIIDADKLIRSLEKNIEILESYKEIPEKINAMITKKNGWLEQILCNIEIISEIISGWIDKNGERFKSWVELYILIKAILKSWQLLIDVFIDYEEECHECKNERNDLQHSTRKLIDLIIPKIPIIKFPKWPDIILDLHNVRAGLNISLPEFNFNERPIILPILPNLYLPEVPNVRINIPSLPLLPEFSLGELPELPSLPKIELPNLPPPPTLPKLFTSLEATLDILKLITKAMCILKKSPFVPEWRAGDQIAFITERTGYLDLDFLDLSLPQFSFPFVDAIKVSTLVNFEVESNFITEFARQIVAPINVFTNNIVNKLDIGISDLDYSDLTPQDINIDISGKINKNTGNPRVTSVSKNITKDKKAGLFVNILAEKFIGMLLYIDKTKDIKVNNKDFISLVNESLNSPKFGRNENLLGIRDVWKNVQNLTYSKEDKFIKELKRNNSEKFETLKNIIQKEIEKNKKLKQNINNFSKTNLFTKILNENKNDIKSYNKILKTHNDKFILSLSKLVGGEDINAKKLKTEAKKIVNKLNTGFKKFDKGKLLASINNQQNTIINNNTSCSIYNKSSYRYNYKGLYVIEEDKNYRLFDYLDELNGDEKISFINLDGDGDNDIVYVVSGQVFLKENLKNKKIKTYLKTPPIVVDSKDNKFYNTINFIEAVNHFKELNIQNSYINLGFLKHKNTQINNYRIEFFEIIDKFSNEKNSLYIPENTKKSIIDSFSNANEITKTDENENYITRNNLSYISYVPNIPGIKLKTKKLENIKDDLKNGNLVNISVGTKLYSSGKNVKFKYYINGNNTSQTAYINKYRNIEFKKNIKIYSIDGDLFTKSNLDSILKGSDIRNHLNKPIFEGSSISFIGDNSNLSADSHLDITYYDNSKIGLDFRNIKNYNLYNLGNSESDYSVRLNVKNNFYYAKIKAFSSSIIGTSSNMILLSPQKQADISAPEINISSVIKIPVYQKKLIDLSPHIYENSGIRNIEKVFIDFDLKVDKNKDGNKKNDINTHKIKVYKNLSSIKIEFGPYNKLFSKDIAITLIDNNGNIGYREIPFQVYSPKPFINDDNLSVIKGNIDENLTGEPINLYRYRGGIIKKLKNTQGKNKVLTKDGNYSFEVKNTNDGLTLTNLGKEIAEINEYTGVIKLKDLSARVNVYSSNHGLNKLEFPKIVLNLKGDDIYYQYLGFLKNPSISFTNSFDLLEKDGIYINFSDKSNYSYYKIPLNAPYNPGTIVIYRNSDKGKEPLFTIFENGRINTINDFYSLKYSNYKNNIVFKLVDKHFNREIAQVLFRVSGGYVME